MDSSLAFNPLISPEACRDWLTTLPAADPLAVVGAIANALDDLPERGSLSALKVQVGKSGRFVAQNAVQLHGGMGMTEDLAIGHYFKRMTVIDAWFGNTDHHLRRFGSLAA